MFRRPSWWVLGGVTVAVVVFNQLLTILGPPTDPRCVNLSPDTAGKQARDGRAVVSRVVVKPSQLTQHLQHVGTVNTSLGVPLRKPNSSPRTHFTLVSEMNTTTHLWHWPETKKLLNRCRERYWGTPGSMPKVSVIVSFHNNEQVFSIVHTLHSLVQRTPPEILREIILIDDNSVKDDLKQLLDMHVKHEFGSLVQFVRSPVDLGLIRARLNGIRMAKGDVVIVMDSHVEVQPRWIEPLLYEIGRDQRTLATSYLDWMEKTSDGWSYRHGASSWKTYFDLSFTFGFQALSNKEFDERKRYPMEPVRSAVTVGTVWAMNRKWFHEVGGFDEGMQKWGGENIDLAVRVWLFGGRVINVPCSHVAHLESAKGRAYRDGWTQYIHLNYKRFAEVWLDDYKPLFYQHIPSLVDMDPGDLSTQLAIKARALHNFTWFLENVFPELGLPGKRSLAWGGVQSMATRRERRCLDWMYSFVPSMTVCNEQALATQGFFWTDEGFIRLSMHILLSDNTDSIPLPGSTIRVGEYTGYHQTGLATRWFHIKDGPIIEVSSGLCLESHDGYVLQLRRCDGSDYQKWAFKHYSKKYNTMMSKYKSPVKAFIPFLKKRMNGTLIFQYNNKRRRTTLSARRRPPRRGNLRRVYDSIVTAPSN